VPELSHDIPHDSPSDEVLLELGRLTWAAINLEDVVYTVCQCIRPNGDYRDTPAVARIKQAREALTTQPDEKLRARADKWLEAAAQALADRHAVLHSEPVTFVSLSADVTPGDLDPLLAHFPRDRSRPQVNTPLTASALRSLRWHLESARAGWVELAVELDEARVRERA